MVVSTAVMAMPLGKDTPSGSVTPPMKLLIRLPTAPTGAAPLLLAKVVRLVSASTGASLTPDTLKVSVFAFTLVF